MKILWVKAGGLVPLDTGGKIRSYHILKELARKHTVTLFTFYAAHPGDAHSGLSRIFKRVINLPIAIPAPGTVADYVNYGRKVFSGLPYSMSKFYHPSVTQKLNEVLNAENYDVIVADFVFGAGVVPWEFACPKLFFTHNVEATIWRRRYQVARNPLSKVVCWREARTMEKAESLYLNLADRVLTVSEVDRDAFARFTDPDKIEVIPTGVDVDYYRPEPPAREANTLVFTGSMDWLPNEDGILWFVDKILPAIRREVPDVTLEIVGRRPSAALQRRAAAEQGTMVTGSVKDIRPFVRDATVYIVPLRVGGGTRLKIFEAMAMGKAVVSTNIGAEGLPVTHGKQIILADEAEDFARQTVALLRNPAARAATGRAARQLVETGHSWASVAARFESVLAALRTEAAEMRTAGSRP